MNTFLNFTFTGDPAFDFFFSITASFGLAFFIGTSAILMFKDK